MSDKISQIIGWVGMILLITGYLLNSFGILSSQGVSYQMFNLVGATGVGIAALFRKNYPSVVLQIFWGGIAVVAIIRVFSLF